MAEFLSDAWIDELDRAAKAAPATVGADLVIQQIVLDEQGVETCYVIRVAHGQLSVETGRADDADITLTQDRTTAAKIARGELSAQVAFMAGRLRVGGDLRAVIDRSRELASMADIFAATRSTTAW